MKYAEAIQRINTDQALAYLGFEFKRDGAYLKFACPECGKESAIRYHGEKKNVSYCPGCHKGSNVVAIASMIKGIEFQEAKNLLLEKATYTDRPIEDELNLCYDLEWTDFMEKQGLNREVCEKLGVGKPKGKTMLSGHTVFTVFSEHGVKIAYFGIKDEKAKYHSSFNPELYLWNYNNIAFGEEVWVTTDMFNCLRLIASGKQSCCNFGLPYLSLKQYQLLSNCDRVVFEWRGDKRDIAYANIMSLKTFYRFSA